MMGWTLREVTCSGAYLSFRVNHNVILTGLLCRLLASVAVTFASGSFYGTAALWAQTEFCV